MKVFVEVDKEDISPEQLAILFSHMGSDEQARFFNKVAEEASSYINMQLQYITEEDGLTLAGRRVMQSIGEYSHWGIVCKLIKDVRNETTNP